MRFAEGTAVAAEKSRAEIETIKNAYIARGACSNGHRLSTDGVYFVKARCYWRCRACQRANDARFKARRGEARPPDRSPFEGQSERDMAWAAGLFEGEGTITISAGGKRPYTSISVQVTSTDVNIVTFFRERWPGGFHLVPKKGNARSAWVWRLSSRKAGWFLRALAPWLVTERVQEKAKLALHSQSLRRQGNRTDVEGYRATQAGLMAEMRRLNRRGVVRDDGRTVYESILEAAVNGHPMLPPVQR